MANTLLTIQMITNEALAVLKNELMFTKFVNRQYDGSFAKSGAKIGDTLNIRKPPRYVGRTGQTLSLEDSTETSVPLQLTTQAGVDMYFSSADLALRVDQFRDRFIMPAMANVANRVDRDGLALATAATYNAVGTPGSNTVNGQMLLNAGALLDKTATPRSTNLRSVIWTPDAQAQMVGSLSGLFNAPDKISDQYNSGTMGKAFGFKNSMDQNTINQQYGAQGGTPIVNGAGQTGSQLVVSGATAAAAVRYNAGDIFTIMGVFGVNPQSRQSTNALQQFVVTANASSDGNGNVVIPISPAIIPTGQYQNVTASPANNAQLVFAGTPSVVSQQSIAFHKDAFTLACADLPLPGGVDMAARATDEQTGLSIRMVRAYNVTTDQFPCRLDILYGWAALYPEWSCRIQS